MLSVLIADDSLVMRRMVARSLELSGVPPHELREACNGAEALGILREAYVDIVLCDLHMPVMDGLTATKTIREAEQKGLMPKGRSPRVPIIALTANAIKGDRERCIEVGMDDYLTKPINPQRLLQVLRKRLKKAPSATKIPQGAGA